MKIFEILFWLTLIFHLSSGLTSLNFNSIGPQYPGYMINGEPSAQLGASYTTCNFNRDNFEDFVMGSPFLTVNSQPQGGRAYVFYGRSSNQLNNELTGVTFPLGIRINGAGAYHSAGQSVSCGDVNGDNFDDIVIGAIGVTNNNQTFAGSVYVVYGKSIIETIVNLRQIDGYNGYVIFSSTALENVGAFVNAQADLNGDLIDDLIIGSYGGNIYVVFGNTLIPKRSVNLATLDGTNGFTIRGLNAGKQVIAAGSDVNGDFIADFVVGGLSNNQNLIYVLYGRRRWPVLLDLNSLSATDGFKIIGTALSPEFSISADMAGDINNDFLNDILIGDMNARRGGQQLGAVYALFGRKSNWPSQIDITQLDGSNGFVFWGSSPREFFGTSVVFGGDLNGDLIGDFLVGSPGSSPNFLAFAGQTFIVYGQKNYPAVLSSYSGYIWQGVSPGDLSGSAIASGDFNGDGRQDISIGARGSSLNGFADSGSLFNILSTFSATSPTLLPPNFISPSFPPTARRPVTVPTIAPSVPPTRVPTTRAPLNPNTPTLPPTPLRPSRPVNSLITSPVQPTPRPTFQPAPLPTAQSISRPTSRPTPLPTIQPTSRPTPPPTVPPTSRPTSRPSQSLPTTSLPVFLSTFMPSLPPTFRRSRNSQ